MSRKQKIIRLNGLSTEGKILKIVVVVIEKLLDQNFLSFFQDFLLTHKNIPDGNFSKNFAITKIFFDSATGSMCNNHKI